MKPFFLLIIIVIFIPFSAAAQEEELAGAGPKGRFTKEQAQEIALRSVPGEVLSSEGWWENNRFFMGVKIARADGSIFDVEINTLTGQVQEIEIEHLERGASLPMNIIAQNVAEAIAGSYVEEKTSGGTHARVLKSQIMVYERKPVYRIEIKKLVRIYEVLVDAASGKVLSHQKID